MKDDTRVGDEVTATITHDGDADEIITQLTNIAEAAEDEADEAEEELDSSRERYERASARAAKYRAAIAKLQA